MSNHNTDETRLGIQESLSSAFDAGLDVQFDELARLVLTAPRDAPAIVKKFAHHINSRRQSVMPLYHDVMDRVFIPAFPGQFIIVNAHSSNGKTTFKNRWIKEHEQFLVDTGQDDAYIIDIDLENSQESILSRDFFSGRPEMVADVMGKGIDMTSAVINESMAMVNGRVITIAAPLGRPDVYKHLSVENIGRLIARATKSMFNRPIRISAIFFDYLQILAEQQYVSAGKMNERLSNDSAAIRNLGSVFKCPTVMMTQATYPRYSQAPHTFFVPDKYEIAGTQTPHTQCDKQIALHMPITRHERGANIEHQFLGGRSLNYHVTPNLQFQVLQKQRPLIAGMNSIGNHRWTHHIDFATGDLLTLVEAEARARRSSRGRPYASMPPARSAMDDIPL